jgi:2-hydroxychromene-2-carboxylate isomerase
MTLHYDLFWSFRSPFSYLVTGRLVALEAAYDIQCHTRPVYPMAVRGPEYLESRDPLWFTYLRTDVKRLGQYLKVPFRWPRPDSVYKDPETGRYTKEQPYIHRLTRLGVAASQRGRGLQFLDRVGTLLWSGKVDNWHEGDHLARATASAGLDLGEMDAAINAAPEKFEAVIQDNHKAQREGGHFGVPLMVFNGEPFFGQDRFDLFKWRLEKSGLQSRRA